MKWQRFWCKVRQLPHIFVAKEAVQSDFLRKLGLSRKEKKPVGSRRKKNLFGVLELSYKLANRRRGQLNNSQQPDPIYVDYLKEYDGEVKAGQKLAELAGKRFTRKQFDDWRTIVRHQIDIITQLDGKKIPRHSTEEQAVFQAVHHFVEKYPKLIGIVGRQVMSDLADHRPK